MRQDMQDEVEALAEALRRLSEVVDALPPASPYRPREATAPDRGPVHESPRA